MKCPKCNNEMITAHSNYIANVEFESIRSCINPKCDYSVEENCGVNRKYYNGKYQEESED